MSDSSFPRPPTPSPTPRDERREGARVVELRAEKAEAEGDAARSSERPLGEVVAFPAQQRTQRRRRAATADAATADAATADATTPGETTPGAEVREPSGRQLAEVPAPAEGEAERPRYLASELLKQDWYPRAPLSRTLRWGAVAVGGAGAAAVMALGASSTGALALAAILAACAVLGALPFAAPLRGAVLAVLALGGTALAGWMRLDDGQEPAAPLLVAGITLAASALFFRAAHRTARFARALVGVGLATTMAWLVLTGGLDALVVESFAWHDCVFPALRVLLGLVLVLSLLTFLDPTGHGGAWAAGGALLVWLALETTASLARTAWSGDGAVSLADPASLATLAFPALAALAAGGLCQLWVLVSRRTRGRRSEAPTRVTHH